LTRTGPAGDMVSASAGPASSSPLIHSRPTAAMPGLPVNSLKSRPARCAGPAWQQNRGPGRCLPGGLARSRQPRQEQRFQRHCRAMDAVLINCSARNRPIWLAAPLRRRGLSVRPRTSNMHRRLMRAAGFRDARAARELTRITRWSLGDWPGHRLRSTRSRSACARRDTSASKAIASYSCGTPGCRCSSTGTPAWLSVSA